MNILTARLEQSDRMNWAQGSKRIWIVCSLIWVVGVPVLVAYLNVRIHDREAAFWDTQSTKVYERAVDASRNFEEYDNAEKVDAAKGKDLTIPDSERHRITLMAADKRASDAYRQNAANERRQASFFFQFIECFSARNLGLTTVVIVGPPLFLYAFVWLIAATIRWVFDGFRPSPRRQSAREVGAHITVR